MKATAPRRAAGPEPGLCARRHCSTGASKAGGWTDYASLDIALRDDLEARAPRATAVLDPFRLEPTNWREVFGDTAGAACSAPAHPQRPELGTRAFGVGPALWIERDDFAEIAPEGFFRLFPGNEVRLKYGVIIESTGCIKDAAGHVTAVQARVLPDTCSGTPGAWAGTCWSVISARVPWPPSRSHV
jgi:glutaminyl-tRNA synthetase